MENHGRTRGAETLGIQLGGMAVYRVTTRVMEDEFVAATVARRDRCGLSLTRRMMFLGETKHERNFDSIDIR